MTGRVERRRELNAIAHRQFGLMTSADAARCGYDRQMRSYHRGVGNWISTGVPGIMRVADWPVDPHVAVHAWALWFGPRFRATSWTGLELFGLVPVDESRPVDAVLSPGPDIERAMTRAARGHLWEARRSGQLILHRVQHVPRPTTRQPVIPELAALPIVRLGVTVRPAAEALCIALSDNRTRTAARELTLRLVDEGRIDLADLDRTAQAIGATRMLNLAWELSR